MSRWTYLIPRIIILALMALALFIGADPILRRTSLNSIEQSIGSRVEVGTFRWNLKHQKLLLKELEIADPRSPMQNLLQADMAYLQFDSSALWHRQFVVTGGQTSRLMPGTPRTSSGLLPDSLLPKLPQRATYQPENLAQESLPPFGQQWLDRLNPVVPSSAMSAQSGMDQLQQSAKTIREQFGARVQSLRTAMDNLQLQTNRVQQQLRTVGDNPLRSQYQKNPFTQLDGISKRTQQIESAIISLNETIPDSLAPLDAAANREANLVRPKSLTSFNSEEISDLLLARLHARYVDQSMNLVRWLQSVLPEPTEDFGHGPKRGVDIDLSGVPVKPTVLIKELELSGEASFLDQQLNFNGTAFDLTNTPQRHHLPGRVELRAQGENHFQISAILDRRNPDHPRDELTIASPDLYVGTMSLGDEKTMLISVADGAHLHADAKLVVENGMVSGKLTITHQQVTLHADRVAELAGGKATQIALNAALTDVREFKSEVEIFGPIDQYEYRSNSDLGRQITRAFNSRITEQQNADLAKRLRMIESTKATLSTSLAESFRQQLQRLSQDYRKHRQRLAELESPSRKDSLRR